MKVLYGVYTIRGDARLLDVLGPTDSLRAVFYAHENDTIDRDRAHSSLFAARFIFSRLIDENPDFRLVIPLSVLHGSNAISAIVPCDISFASPRSATLEISNGLHLDFQFQLFDHCEQVYVSRTKAMRRRNFHGLSYGLESEFRGFMDGSGRIMNTSFCALVTINRDHIVGLYCTEAPIGNDLALIPTDDELFQRLGLLDLPYMCSIHGRVRGYLNKNGRIQCDVLVPNARGRPRRPCSLFVSSNLPGSWLGKPKTLTFFQRMAKQLELLGLRLLISESSLKLETSEAGIEKPSDVDYIFALVGLLSCASDWKEVLSVESSEELCDQLQLVSDRDNHFTPACWLADFIVSRCVYANIEESRNRFVNLIDGDLYCNSFVRSMDGNETRIANFGYSLSRLSNEPGLLRRFPTQQQGLRAEEDYFYHACTLERALVLLIEGIEARVSMSARDSAPSEFGEGLYLHFSWANAVDWLQQLGGKFRSSHGAYGVALIIFNRIDYEHDFNGIHLQDTRGSKEWTMVVRNYLTKNRPLRQYAHYEWFRGKIAKKSGFSPRGPSDTQPIHSFPDEQLCIRKTRIYQRFDLEIAGVIMFYRDPESPLWLNGANLV